MLYFVKQNQRGVIMLAIRLDKELEKQIDLLAKTRGSNRSAVVREAIIQYLEDNEDIQLAKESLKHMNSTKSLKQLRKELGLDS
jgi:RHH-type rel operon transcriptional repressor/antitoxin RelB